MHTNQASESMVLVFACHCFNDLQRRQSSSSVNISIAQTKQASLAAIQTVHTHQNSYRFQLVCKEILVLCVCHGQSRQLPVSEQLPCETSKLIRRAGTTHLATFCGAWAPQGSFPFWCSLLPFMVATLYARTIAHMCLQLHTTTCTPTLTNNNSDVRR